MIQKFESFINEHRTDAMPEFEKKTKDPDALIDYFKENYELDDRYSDFFRHYKEGPVSIPACKTKNGYLLIWFYFNDSCKYSNVYVGDLYKYLERKDDRAAARLAKAAEEAYDNLTNEFCIWYVDQVIEILGTDSLIQKK